MIENRFLAFLLLVLMVLGAVLFTIFRSPWGPALTLIGIIGYFLLNK